MSLKDWLSVKGFMRTVENGSGTKEVFDWKNALADAAIIAALGFFGSLTASALVGGDGVTTCLAAGITAGFEFFTVLAVKRGLVARKQ